VIDFRYHLVSIIAVFLALAIGIVVGTTALNGYVVDDLRKRNGAVIRDKRSLEGTVRDLRTQVSRRDDFATAVAPEVVGGQLAGQRVVLVLTPGASESVVKDLTRLIGLAGGTTTGQLRIRGDLLDPTKNAVVDNLVAQVAPAGLTLPTSSTSDRAGLELAAALVASPGPDGISSDAAAKILGGFTSAQLVDVQQPSGSTSSSSALSRASLALVVTSGSDGHALDDTGRQRQQAMLSLVRSLDARSSGAVLAGPETAAETGGLIQAVRADGVMTDAVSTVDSADSPYGEVSAILALREQDAGRAGRYGSGPGSQAAAPTLPTS
jgi:hypothetical protein